MNRLLVCFLIFGLLVQLPDITLLEATAVALSVYVFLTFIHLIGERIALLECIQAIAALEILLVPAITYWVFPASMPIESTPYFSYALPAYSAFYLGIHLFANSHSYRSHKSYVDAARQYLHHKQSVGIVLFFIGLSGFLTKFFVPNVPAILGTLPSYCLFISVFYVYYSRNTYRFLIIGLVAVVLLTYTVRAGMFGDLFFWLMLTTLFGAASVPAWLSTRVKSVFVMLAFLFLLLIQSVKGEYRFNTWGYHRGERNGNAALLGDLVADRLTNPEKLFNIDHLFLSFVRFNQGIMIGSAMAKVPMHEPFAKGEVLLSFLYPFVPRLIWESKPQTGGYENIHRFTTLPQSENTSINLSPLGEGYVNFGYGGILFALVYGLLLGSVFKYVLYLSSCTPTIIFWLPMLYIGCLTMETDILSTWGSLTNNAIFIALLFWLFRRAGSHL
ncbi:hypothetical protein [Spirosoma sp. KNUC1025]|uniref:hypothetical protein n=1 Tax=Spirosoma sp. KNUC1025 TaxID=2894082 RepID=UPI003865613A|nr:hypothetical protein LN737_04385 [Spirosoma sp. KNUC1025]